MTVVLYAALALITLDQATKHWVHSRFALGDGFSVIPGFFDIRYVQNTGAAWGILQGMGALLIVLSIGMLILLLFGHRHLLEDRPSHRMIQVLLVGGIVGNLVDRVRLGYVVDFLYFYWGEYDFPAFNIADSAICIGVFLYLLSQYSGRKLSGEAVVREPEPAVAGNQP